MAGTVILRDNSKEVLKKLDAAAYKALVAIGETSVTAVKKKCPVVTGRLRNSITYAVAGHSTSVASYRRDNVAGGVKGKHKYYSYGSGAVGTEDEKAVYIGTNVEYAPAVEYGTRKDGTAKKSAHFFSNGIKSASGKNKKIVEAYLKNA